MKSTSLAFKYLGQVILTMKCHYVQLVAKKKSFLTLVFLPAVSDKNIHKRQNVNFNQLKDSRELGTSKIANTDRTWSCHESAKLKRINNLYKRVRDEASVLEPHNQSLKPTWTNWFRNINGFLLPLFLIGGETAPLLFLVSLFFLVLRA